MAPMECPMDVVMNRAKASFETHRMRQSKTYAAVYLPALLVLTVALGGGTPKAAPAADSGAHEKLLLAQELSNVPGFQLTAVLVTYPPGGKSPQHHHAGSVYAYVTSGSIRSQNSATGPAKVFRSGESFFEPAGSVHLVSENASATQSASMIAVFVAPAGATLTAPERP
jgi:quercetin dioxygenase-like cupin family protein